MKKCIYTSRIYIIKYVLVSFPSDDPGMPQRHEVHSASYMEWGNIRDLRREEEEDIRKGDCRYLMNTIYTLARAVRLTRNAIFIRRPIYQ